MGDMVLGGQQVGAGVAAGGARIAEGITGDGAGHGHPLPRHGVGAVPEGGLQVLKGQLGGPDGQAVGHRVGPDRAHGVQAVGDHVQAGGGGDGGGHSVGQHRVHQGQPGEHGTAENGDFGVGGVVGEHRAPAHLAAGSGGGWHGNEGQRIGDGPPPQQLQAGAVHGGRSRSGLGAVHGGAAAQADDGPGPQLPGPPGTGVHVVTGGIGLHLRDDVQHAAARALLQPRGHAAAVGEGIGDDQRPVQPPLGHKLSQLIQLPGAEDHFHRVVILPHGSNSSLLVGTA